MIPGSLIKQITAAQILRTNRDFLDRWASKGLLYVEGDPGFRRYRYDEVVRLSTTVNPAWAGTCSLCGADVRVTYSRGAVPHLQLRIRRAGDAAQQYQSDTPCPGAGDLVEDFVNDVRSNLGVQFSADVH
ncbi:hypothetical protein [Catellatospora sp. NPDC049609]|uniref:hypothetical protein n=1 Tax=Catellatospora sp. NPDC049609 TaxID=3155505 RepID=UPI003415A1F9